MHKYAQFLNLDHQSLRTFWLTWMMKLTLLGGDTTARGIFVSILFIYILDILSTALATYIVTSKCSRRCLTIIFEISCAWKWINNVEFHESFIFRDIMSTSRQLPLRMDENMQRIWTKSLFRNLIINFMTQIVRWLYAKSNSALDVKNF